jgi:DNA recombination protein RmuC
MSIETIIILVAILVLAVLLVFLWQEQKQRAQQQDLLLAQIQAFLSRPKEADPTLMIMQQQLDALKEQMRQSLQESANILIKSQEHIGQSLDRAAGVVGEVQSRLGQLEEANKRIYEVGKDIASLQDILKSPKLRGGLGELFLGNLLEQVLPPKYYTLQYTFKSNQKVDAVIHFEDRVVAIDAKFPLENFRRLLEGENEEAKKAAQKIFFNDVKKHIDDIAKKYILPEEGTLDFALMYIPAENVYYETIIKNEAVGDGKDLHTYAMEKKVIPVSPHTFYAYLQFILEGVKGLEIEKEAEVIRQNLSHLQVELKKFREEFDLMGRHLENVRKTYEKAEKHLNKFDQRLETTPGITGEEKQQLPLENFNS